MEYKISTITAIAQLNSLINLEKFFNSIKENDDNKLIYLKDEKIIENVPYIEFGKNKNESNLKGQKKNTKKNTYKKKEKKVKRFDNQLTLIINVNNNGINMKIFKNGRIQMTGLKDISNGPIAIIEIIKIINNINKNNLILEDNVKELTFDNYKICLINSDFKFPFKIKRDKLFQFINANTELICSYEPCIYPGVKIQYFYNDNLDGICRCPEKFCSNKNKKSNCIKITIAVFESGCTIITGAKSLEQINNSYNYINNLITNNISQFKKINIDELL